MPKPRLAGVGIALLALSCAGLVHCAPASDASTSAFPEAERLMGDAREAKADERGGFVFDTHRHVLSARVDGSPNIDLDTRGSHARIERIGATTKNAHLRGNVVRTSGDAERFVFARGEEIEELALLTEPTSLAYRFVVPEGFHLRALGPTMVEVDDASGDPWLRMRADRAWSEDRREIRVALAIEGDVVRVVVPSDAPYPLFVDPIWASASSMTTARESHAATLLGDGRVLITGGFANLDRDTAEIYDPRSGLFTALPAKLKAGRSRHASVMLRNGKVLLFGGNGLAPDAELFDPKTSTFTAIAAPSTMYVKSRLAIAAPLLDGRVLLKGVTTAAIDAPPAAEIYDPTASTFTATNAGTLDGRGTMVTLPDGKVLLFGESEVERWDPTTTTWTMLAGTFSSQPENRGAALMRDGRVLVTGGGLTCGPSSVLCGYVRAYDPASETYGTPTPLIEPDGRGASAKLLPSGKVLVAGSFTSTTKTRIFDPSTDSFGPDAVDTISTHRAQTVTTLPGGDVLILGGEQNTTDLRTWTGAIAPTSGNMVAARYAAATQRLKDGTVLIAGGSFHPASTTGSSLSSAELYDPATKTFSATTGSMTTARENAIVAMLPSGKVLIAGGNEVGTNAAKATAEVYDPATKQFTAVGSMTAARTRHAAATLPGGKILVTGGCSDASTCLVGLDSASSRLKSAEIFDPATSTFTATNAMLVARCEHGLVTMTDGRVLVVGTEGQGGLNVEVFDPTKGQFDIVQSLFMPSDQHGRSAVLLPNGKVFVGGGFSGPNLVTDATAANPSWTSAPSIGFSLLTAQYLPTPGGEQLLFVGGVQAKGNGLVDADTAESRVSVFQLQVGLNAATLVTDFGAGAGRRDVASANVDHGILVAGGDSGFGGSAGSVTDTAYVHSDGADDSWRPKLTVAPAKIKAGKDSTLEGLRLTSTLGDTPVAFWQPAGSKTFLPTRISSFSTTSATWTAPVTTLHGNGWLHVVNEGLASNSIAVEVEPADNGTACKYGAECASGFCTEGVCCDQACSGTCQACSVRRKKSGSEGTCETIQPGTDPDNKCILGIGLACTSNAACGSGFCVAGVCCNEACNGACRTCGTGVCQDTPTCGDAGPTEPPVICDEKDGHTLTKGGEFVADCGDYKCTPDAKCRQTCESAKDCVAPLICNYDGACVDAPFVRPAQESLFGCSSSPTPANGTAAVFGFIALAIGRSIRSRSRRRGAAR